MSASAMKTFVRDLFKQTEDYKSLTQRIIRDRYVKHINVDALAEDDRALLRETVDFIVKEMIENATDNGQQENIAENDQSSISGDRTRQNKNMNEKKSVKCSSDLEEDDVKVTKKGKKTRIIDDSDSDGSSEESKRASSKSDENVASSNDDEDSHSEPQHGKRKQPKIPELAPKKIKLSDSSNNSKKPTKKKAIPKKMQSDGSDSETSSIEDINISKKSKPLAKTVISNSKKLLKKQKLSSSEDEALENEDKLINKKIFEGSDSDESEPLQTYKDKDKKEKANLDNNKKVVNKKKQLKSDEENSSSESDDQTLADVKKSNPEQLSATDSSDQSDILAISTSKSKKKLMGKSCRVEEEKKKFKGKKQSSSKMPTKEADDKDEAVKKLEKIARACGALPVGKHYKLAFENCRNNKERAERLKQMLRDAGLTGTFSMKSAETLKLKREAAELLSANVGSSIMSEGRGRRSANNPFSASASNSKDTSTSKEATIESAKKSFSRLKGIVDSEEESD